MRIIQPTKKSPIPNRRSIESAINPKFLGIPKIPDLDSFEKLSIKSIPKGVQERKPKLKQNFDKYFLDSLII